MIFTSPLRDAPILVVPFHEFVLYRAAERNEKPGFVDAGAGKSFSYKELVKDVYLAFASSGCGKREVLRCCFPTSLSSRSRFTVCLLPEA
jgi:hypothetical protein